MCTDLTPQRCERLKKDICKLFSANDLKITIEANSKTVDFLDVNLNLISGLHKPFTKPETKVQYINVKSNHPPLILKNIPSGIEDRLSMLSSNEEIFNEAKQPFQKALDDSGFNYILKYNPPTSTNTKRNRPRKILWFNPPYSNTVKTNISREFINLVKKCFPSDHPLHKHFNCNNVKISYSCMPNFKVTIGGINKAKMKNSLPIDTPSAKDLCNCQAREECQFSNQCLKSDLLYKATVTHLIDNKQETYTGQTCNTFKTRVNQHNSNFRSTNEKTKKATSLSAHIWKLKGEQKDFDIKWKLISEVSSYRPGGRRCNLCIAEINHILFKKSDSSLNSRNELFSYCRHRTRFKLDSVG